MDKHLLLTRFDPVRSNSGEMLSIDDVLEILSIPLLGVIPESKEILRASNIGAPVTINAAGGPAGQAYLEAARRLGGETTCPSCDPGREEDLFHARCSAGGRHESVSAF